MAHFTVASRPASALARTPILGPEGLRKVAPSIFATAAHGDVSGRYKFIPTTEVIDILADRGFRPVKAGQTVTRDPERGVFARHVIRFRHDDHLVPALVGGEIPELVLYNSHDRSSAYQIMAGIFRLVCANGLCVQSADFGSISVRHSGGDEFQERIIDATYQVVEEMPRIAASIEAWKQIELAPPQRLALATAALELRQNSPITPDTLLTPRRVEDRGSDLWSTSQVIQENLIKGGLRGLNASGRRTTTRPVKSVGEDIKTNRALWRLTEEMAKLVS